MEESPRQTGSPNDMMAVAFILGAILFGILIFAIATGANPFEPPVR